MEKVRKYRYPGINSFETSDVDIFFGREDDRKKIADLIETEKTVLLYSRSGLGKSSLLKAALIPELKIRNYNSYYIRFSLYQENSLPPVQKILRSIIQPEKKQLPETFLQKFINRPTSLWYAFKSLQIFHAQKDRPIVLLFDQFEEISSYHSKHILELKQQIAELLYVQIPPEYLEALKVEDLLTEPLTDKELDLLYKPIRVKVVFAIRSDQMSVINQLSDYLPNILKVFYELKPLSREQALKAIVEPAKKEGEFITPKFIYQNDALNKIIESLASQKNNEIDTAQLQILLQYIEQDIVENRQDTDITAEDLGDLNKVYENYYRNSLQKLKTEQVQAQMLIEERLIVEGRRVSYDKGLCLLMVSIATLDSLIEIRLLRREPNTMGGYSYEVSHDSLITPILKASEERKRKEEEERQKEKYELQLNEQRKKQKQQRLIINIVSAAAIISISLGVWAFNAQSQAEEANKYKQQLLELVQKQKDSTQAVYNNLINAEIVRYNMEISNLNNNIRAYSNSNDPELVNETKKKMDSIKNIIDDLNEKLIK